MTETKNKRRSLIKNIAIIFLVILLLLTFFSNTILNSSLPEVAYQYPSSGSITATLRGTGTVSSNESYEVTINEERKVKAVAIEVGDTVTAGQNIILLDETESEELTAAREELATLQLAYQKALLSLEYDADSASSVELQILQAQLQTALNNQSKANTGDSEISAAEAKVATAKAKYQTAKSKLEAKEDALGASTSSEKAALTAAQTAYDNAVAAQTQAQTNLEYVQSISGGEGYDEVMASYEAAAEEYLALQEEAQELEDELEELKSAQTKLERYNEKLEDAQEELEDLQDTLSDAKSDMSTVSSAASSVDEDEVVSVSPTDTITDTNGSTVYIYYCSRSDLEDYLDDLEAWLKEYNAGTRSDTAMETDDGTSYLSTKIAASIATLKSVLNSGTTSSTYSGTDRVTCNSRQYYLNGMTKSELEDLYESFQNWCDRLESQISSAEDDVKSAQKSLTEIENETGTTYDTVSSAIRSKEAEITENTKALASKQTEMDKLKATIDNEEFTAAYEELQVANELVNTTTKALYDAQTAYNAVYSEDELDELQEAVDDAKEDWDDAESDLAAIEAEYSLDADSAYEAVLSAQKAIQEYYDSLTEEELADAQADLDLQAQADEVTAAEERVAELEANASQQIITAEYGGVVTEMNVGAGSYTTAGEAMVVIERTDNGYSMSFSVTTEQASKVKVGDQAEVVNQYGTDITAVLANIQNDPDNPGTNKLLVFSLTGDDVVAGQSLTVAIGERSASYDLIVPNSAVRTDSAGKFVLAVTVKSSPLGNRYIAKRVDVEVLASDDNNSAVSGDLSSGDTIITTSSTPIESGMQVRLAE